LSLVATAASQTFSDGTSSAESRSVQNVVASESAQVKQQFPTAKLFQVSILDVVPTKLAIGQTGSSAIESSYYIGNPDEFVQASKETSGRPGAADAIVVRKSSAAEGCMNGYPGKGINTCAEQVGGPKKEPGKLNPEILSNLGKLVPQLSSFGIDVNEPVILTLTTAGRALEGLIESRSPNEDLLEHLRTLPVDRPVLSVFEASGPNRSSSTWLIADSGELLGRSRVVRSHAPPGLSR
jgi:hypothetical protein